jgi:hypothetical protein
MVSELDAVRGWVCVQRACPKRGRQPSVAALRRQQLCEERERQHDRRAHHTIDSRGTLCRAGGAAPPRCVCAGGAVRARPRTARDARTRARPCSS